MISHHPVILEKTPPSEFCLRPSHSAVSSRGSCPSKCTQVPFNEPRVTVSQLPLQEYKREESLCCCSWGHVLRGRGTRRASVATSQV